jgi:hypothetical protein
VASRAYLAFEPSTLVDDLAANDLIADLKSEDDLASSVNRSVADELRDNQGQLAQPFWVDLAGEIPFGRGASQPGGGRIWRKLERKVGGHQVPMREKGRGLGARRS